MRNVGERIKITADTSHTDVIAAVKQNYRKELAALERALTPTKTFQKLEAERSRLVAKAVNKTATDPDYVRLNELDSKHPKRFQREEKRRIKAMQDISVKLRSRNGVTGPEASKMAKAIDVDLSVSRFINQTEIHFQMMDFFQMTGGKGSATIKQIMKDKDRAYTNKFGKINIGGSQSKNALWHEAGHHIEFSNPEIARLSEGWRDSKATGATTTLNEIINSSRYRATEVAKPDKYATPYVGKVYEDSATEVISIGMEHFRLPENMIRLYEDDKSHFLFTLGVLDADV